MNDIVFVNLETEQKFLASVLREVKSIKNVVSYLPKSRRPKFKYVQAGNEITLYNSVISTNRIAHISGHGSPLGAISSRTKNGARKTHALQDFVDYFEKENLYLDLDCLILDSCWSAGYLWRRQIAKISNPNRPLILIAAIRPLRYDHAEEFFASFYGWLLDMPLPRNRDSLQERIREAFNVAQYNFLLNHKLRVSVMRITEL